jgi:two-component system, OmpR family, heavy metal sensor histidine kinase CusS
MKPLSLTARISLLFACCAAVVLLGLGWIVARAVEAHFLEMDRHEIEGKLSLVRNLLAKVSRPGDLDAVTEQLDNALVGHHGLSIALIAGDGSIWFASRGQDYPDALLRQSGNNGLVVWETRGRTYRGLTAPVVAGFPNAPGFTAAIALDISHHRQFMDEFLAILELATTLAAIATAALGWLATRTGLQPLRRVTALATKLSASNLNERIPETPLPAESRALATAFNAMLARLEDAFRRLSEFSSDIAHELRTPVSNLMTQTQVALSGSRSGEEYREILYSSLEEYERMAQMIGDMLYLAQTDNGLHKPGLEEVDLAAETQGLFEYFEAWAEERGVSLTREGVAVVPGDRLMLRRALSNLLSNAIRHTPRGQSAHVSMETGGGVARIAIENPGEEIPAQHLPRVFDRFYRVDPSRQRKEDGAGLGLAIVKSIVEAHGGTITATSGKGLTRFLVTLPALTNSP